MDRLLNLVRASVLLAAWLAAVICSLAQEAPVNPSVVIFGQVEWPGLHWFPGGSVTLARDPRFSEIAGSFPISDRGRFAGMVEPGEYYLRAVVDLDADGKVSVGDGVGFYGTNAPNTAPEKLCLSAEGAANLTVIRVLFQFGPDLKLVRAITGLRAALATVKGVVSGGDARCYVILWSFPDGWFGYVSPARPDGTFDVTAPAGQYIVVAVRDADGDSRVDPSDPSGMLLGPQGEPRELKVLPQSTVDLGTITLRDRWEASTAGEANGLSPSLPPTLVALQLSPRQATTATCLVMLFSDENLTTLLVSAQLWPGTMLALRPATYYLICGLDVDEDGRLGPGDMIAAATASGKIRAVSLQPGEILTFTIDSVAPITSRMLQSITQGNE